MSAALVSHRWGFTFIEFLVVISIIAVMMTLLLPAVQTAREAARRCQCVNNLLQLNVALQNYEASHAMLPSGVSNPTGPISSTPTGYHMSWITQILPYLGQNNAFKKMDFNVSAYAAENSTVRSHTISSLLCPSNPYPPGSASAAGTNYAASHNDVEAPIDATNTGVFFLNSHVRFDDINDGTSSTIFIGEKAKDIGGLGWMSGTRGTLRNAGYKLNQPAVPIGAPVPGDGDDGEQTKAPRAGESNPDLLVGGFGSYHPGGANFAFGDGSVRFIKNTINRTVFRLLTNRSDGELVGGDQY